MVVRCRLFVMGRRGWTKVEVPNNWFQVIRGTKTTIGEMAIADRTAAAPPSKPVPRQPRHHTQSAAEASAWVQHIRVATFHGFRHECFRHQGAWSSWREHWQPGCDFFFGVQKSFFGIQKTKVMIFLIKLFLTFSKVNRGKKCGSTEGDPKSSQKSSRKQQHKQQKAQTTSRTSRSKPSQAAASCTNSSTKSTKPQQHRKKAPKGSAKTPKGSAAKVAQTVQTATKTAKAATETRGPRRRAPKVSLCSHWRLLVESGWCFRGFF